MMKETTLSISKDPKVNLELLELELEVYEVDSTTMLETMGASVSWNSCSSIVEITI